MKKLLYIMILSFCSTRVYAASCNGLFDQEGWEFINQLFDVLRIGAPIIVMILIAKDMISAITSSTDSNMKTNYSLSKKRIIALILVFLVPTIVKLILNLEPVKINFNLVDDPTCGVGEINQTININK